MATVCYSLAGEGRGHLTRVRAVVEALRTEHRVHLYAPEEIFPSLAAAYAGTDVAVRQIPGLYLHYRHKRLDPVRTLSAAGLYLTRLPGLLDDLERDLDRHRPDLVITDFEPALARAARRRGIPFVSFDHQHFLVVNDLSGLPRWLRWRAKVLGWLCSMFYRGQAETIVSSFYRAAVKPAYSRVTQVGVLLRPAILRARVERGRHLTAYFRRFAPENALNALRKCGREVRLYGLGERPAEGNLRYCAIDERRFVEDLATCEAVVSTAGNQLVGEALYLLKPVLAVPETNNFEQYVNAHFLRAGGGGDWVDMARLDARRVAQFVDDADAYRKRIDPLAVVGNERALAALRRHLPTAIGRPARDLALTA